MTTTNNNIVIVNLKATENATMVEKLRGKLGAAVDYITIFAFQAGSEPLMYRAHDKQKKVFVEYPRFNLITTPNAIYLYLKREGESMPSACYKIKKSDCPVRLVSEEINKYINETVDNKAFLESELTNETIVVFDNLKAGVLIKTVEKDKAKAENMQGSTTYARMFDLIREKLNEVVDSGYLDLLNKTCVMMWQTFNDTKNLNFEPLELVIEKVKEPKKTKEATTETKPQATKKVKEVKEKPVATPEAEFVKPENTPVLENIYDEQKGAEEVKVDEAAVQAVVDSI